MSGELAQRFVRDTKAILDEYYAKTPGLQVRWEPSDIATVASTTEPLRSMNRAQIRQEATA